MRKIIWFDNRHVFGEYDAYIPRFKKFGYEIIKISDLNKFFHNNIDTILPKETVCLILDMSWDSKTRDGFVARSGIAVGMELFDKLMHSSFGEVKKVVYTITPDDEDVKAFCNKHGLLNFGKQKFIGDDFVSSIIQVINQ